MTTRWPVKKVHGEHGSTTGYETALRDNYAGREPQWTSKELHRSAVVEAIQRQERNGKDQDGKD